MQKQWLFAGVFVALFFMLTTSCNRVGGQITRDYSVDAAALEEGTQGEVATGTAEDFTVIRDFGEPPSDTGMVLVDGRSPDDDRDGEDQDEDGEELGQPPRDGDGDGDRQDGDEGRRDYSHDDNKNNDDQPSLGKLKKDADFLACGDAEKVLKYLYFKEGNPDDNFYQWFKKNHLLLQKKACLALKLKDQPDKIADKKEMLSDKKKKIAEKPKKPSDMKEDDQQCIPEDAIEEMVVILYGSFQVNGPSPDDDVHGDAIYLTSWNGHLSSGTGPSGYFVVGTPHYYQVATSSPDDSKDHACAPSQVYLASHHPSDPDCAP